MDRGGGGYLSATAPETPTTTEIHQQIKMQTLTNALWYTHVNSGSLPCAPRCGDPLYNVLETPTFPSTSLEYSLNFWSQSKKKDTDPHQWANCLTKNAEQAPLPSEV